MLLSPAGETLELGHLAAGDRTRKSLAEAAIRVIETPARKEIHERLVRSWCVVLLLEGKDPAQNVAARKSVLAASRSVTGRMTELNKTITNGPHLVTIAHGDPQERVLRWSLDLEPETESARVAMIVGRGELSGPVLTGSEITTEKLTDLFMMLGRSCSCTTAGHWISGPALPLEWSLETQASVEKELGFDPQNPEVLRSIQSAVREGTAVTLTDATLGYTETSLFEVSELPVESPQKVTSQDAAPVAIAETEPGSRGQYTAVLAIMGLALLVMVGVSVQIFRRKRRDGSVR